MHRLDEGGEEAGLAALVQAAVGGARPGMKRMRWSIRRTRAMAGNVGGSGSTRAGQEQQVRRGAARLVRWDGAAARDEATALAPFAIDWGRD